MAWTHAGLWADSLAGRDGPYVSGSVTVLVSGTATPAVLYANRAKSGTIANPTTTDALGNLELWLEPGLYDLITPISVTPFITITVAPDQADLTGGGGGGGVTSVFGRTGVVVAAPGDYTAAQVGADPAGTAAAAVVGLAVDSTVVHLAGPESVTGVKTFIAAPVLPAASYAAPGNSAVGDAAAQGAAATIARSDHTHGREAFGAVTAQTSFGAASANGAATSVSRSDHAHGTPAAPTIPSASGTVAAETSYGVASAAGAAATFSRGDHTHGSPSLSSTTPAAEAVGAAGAIGVGTTAAKADHVHAMPASAVAGASAVGDTASAGAAATLALSDHRHSREAFGAVTAQTTYGAASANGAATTVARSDHAHGTPAQVTPAGIGAVATTDYTAYTNFGGLVNVTLGGTVPAQSRNEPGTITRLQGTLVVGAGGILANTVFANVAAGSRPAGIPFVVGVRVTGSGANNFLNVALNGDVSYKAALVAADVIQFDGLTYTHA